MSNLIYNNQSATINLPHNRYIDKLLRSDSFEILWKRFIKTKSPTKELSESYAAFSNLKKVCMVRDYRWLHIGDGAHTRTASIFALFSKSINYSIDPKINIDSFTDWNEKYNISNLYAVKQKFENFELDFNQPYGISCVHAHVSLEEVDKKFPHWNILYTNPCCFPLTQTFSNKYMMENGIRKIVDKIDLGIVSHKRQVVIYQKDNRINLSKYYLDCNGMLINTDLI